MARVENIRKRKHFDMDLRAISENLSGALWCLQAVLAIFVKQVFLAFAEIIKISWPDSELWNMKLVYELSERDLSNN